METPKSIEANEADYKPQAWHEYTLQELGAWVHLLTARAQMRSDRTKAEKDITDAEAYLDMMRSKVEDVKSHL